MRARLGKKYEQMSATRKLKVVSPLLQPPYLIMKMVLHYYFSLRPCICTSLPGTALFKSQYVSTFPFAFLQAQGIRIEVVLFLGLSGYNSPSGGLAHSALMELLDSNREFIPGQLLIFKKIYKLNKFLPIQLRFCGSL
uniref:Uncharacterized protein n=1 Tax=Arundo donax TaxID=35708 RepID=A0A0A9DPE4_ARUDO